MLIQLGDNDAVYDLGKTIMDSSPARMEREFGEANQPTSPAQLAEARLRANCHLAIRTVACDFSDGILTLRGSLPSYYLTQLALETVRGISGVALIRNEINVNPRCQPL